MKRKIKKYLNSKEKKEYNNLDKIFELYLNGDIEKILSKYSGVGIYPQFNKLGKSIQLTYNHHNIFVVMDFFDDKYNVVIYSTDMNLDDLDKFSFDYEYQDNFNLEELVNEIYITILNHPKFRDTALIDKKKKAYSIIAWISLCFPSVIFSGIGLYCIITESTVKGNVWWLLFFIIIPLIVWFIFDVKSKRAK